MPIVGAVLWSGAQPDVPTKRLDCSGLLPALINWRATTGAYDVPVLV